MSDNADLTLIIPAYNEEEALSVFLPKTIDFCKEHGYSLILVDDASVDKTLNIMNELTHDFNNVQVIHHKVNRGYGGALISGINACDTELCITLDADGQHRLEDIENLLTKKNETDADLVIGSRVKEKGGLQQSYRSFGKKIIRFFAQLLVDNMNIHDLNSGMKLYETALAKRYVRFCPDTMAFSDVMSLIFLQQKHLVVETPIEVRSRKSGKSVINSRTALDTVIQILNIVMVFDPLRIFGSLGLVIFIAGCLWAIPFLIVGEGLSVLAMLTIMTGFLMIMLGLIAEQLAEIRKKDL